MWLMRLLVCVLFLSGVCFAQELKVRVINSNDGQPLAKQAVTVQFLNETPTVGSSPLRLETDANGEVRFSIPKPLPQHLSVRVALTSEHWHCGCWVMADTAKVIQQGIAQPASTKNAKASSAADKIEPGEIIIAARPFTLGERLLHPFLKQ
jgi:hypothetical protein